MKKVLLIGFLIVGMVSCGKRPCADLARQVCEQSPESAACNHASRLTVDDECRGYLTDVKRYIELVNTTVTTPGVQPPKPVTPSPAETPRANPEPAAEMAAPAPVPTEPAPAPVAKPVQPAAPAPAPVAKPVQPAAPAPAPVAKPVQPAAPAPAPVAKPTTGK